MAGASAAATTRFAARCGNSARLELVPRLGMEAHGVGPLFKGAKACGSCQTSEEHGAAADSVPARVPLGHVRKKTVRTLTSGTHLSVTQGMGPTQQRDRARKREEWCGRCCWAGDTRLGRRGSGSDSGPAPLWPKRRRRRWARGGAGPRRREAG